MGRRSPTRRSYSEVLLEGPTRRSNSEVLLGGPTWRSYSELLLEVVLGGPTQSPPVQLPQEIPYLAPPCDPARSDVALLRHSALANVSQGRRAFKRTLLCLAISLFLYPDFVIFPFILSLSPFIFLLSLSLFLCFLPFPPFFNDGRGNGK